MNATAQPITIFTGVDGGGKTTAAIEYAAAMQDLYVHHGTYSQVFNGLARLYSESMLPALWGYQGIVLDRYWGDEPVYGQVMRRGADRVGGTFARMLERIALRSAAVIVKCEPPWEVVQDAWLQRRNTEYLPSEIELYQVYTLYQSFESALPIITYDYTTMTFASLIKTIDATRALMGGAHEVQYCSVGRLNAPYVLIGDTLASHKDKDAWQQWPFVSWTKRGCSQWFTEQLAALNISERDVLWIHIHDRYDNETPFINVGAMNNHIITLGGQAGEIVTEQGIEHTNIPHPQYWKRFRVREPYVELAEALQGA